MTEDKLRKVNKEKPGIQNVVIKGAERVKRNYNNNNNIHNNNND